MDVQGTCSESFDAAHRAFAQNFDEGLEIGAAVAVTVDGDSRSLRFAAAGDESIR